MIWCCISLMISPKNLGSAVVSHSCPGIYQSSRSLQTLAVDKKLIARWAFNVILVLLGCCFNVTHCLVHCLSDDVLVSCRRGQRVPGLIISLPFLLWPLCVYCVTLIILLWTDGSSWMLDGRSEATPCSWSALNGLTEEGRTIQGSCLPLGLTEGWKWCSLQAC